MKKMIVAVLAGAMLAVSAFAAQEAVSAKATHAVVKKAKKHAKKTKKEKAPTKEPAAGGTEGQTGGTEGATH